MRKLSPTQFAVYAREQVTAAEQILAHHQPANDRYCSCGRWPPCTIAGAAQQTRDHFQAKLALAEVTRKLPALRGPEPERVSRWRRLFGGGKL